MAEISVKNGPIVIKKSYGFDFGGDFCSYVHKRKKIGSGKVGKKFRIGFFLLQSVRLPEANNFFRP